MAETYLSDRQVGRRFGVHRATVWRWAANLSGFPTPVALSPGCTRWRLSAIEDWERRRAEKGAAP